ncbi:MAG: hypothetical protein DLM53_00290 [Candidatus Eremiobacter antarcticus]|nr:MAG: hypothetical protein DLM53_00290 [Candidatus Eremiobacter sp. RRmetagenome_bin22]
MSISAPIHFDEFVGRRAELAFLLEQHTEAVNGRGTMALLGGEPGIGKTRLLSEFRKALESVQNWHAIGSCLEFVQSPYLPFTEIFDHLFGTDKEEFGEHANPLVTGDSPDSQVRTRSSVHRNAKKLQVFTSVAKRLRDLSKVRPIVAIIEDLQWADNASMELLEYLVTPLAKSRVFFLASYRSEPSEQQWLQSPLARLERKGAFRIQLGALSEADSLRLVRQGLRGRDSVSKEGVDKVLELAEGNPLFIEELLRATMDGPADDCGTGEAVSPTLRCAVLRRLGQLTHTQQRILTLAAVIGRSFGLEFVARIAGSSREQVLETFRRARQLQIVRQNPNGLNQFEFHHALTRHILYAELLPAQTLPLHAKIAAQLEKYEDSQTAELAFHWAAAGDSDKAVSYNEAAADQAVQLNAFRDAARLYRRALDFQTDCGEKRASLCNKLADSLYRGGLPESATPWYEESLREYSLLDDRESQSRMLLSLARQCWVAANTEAALPHIERAIQLTESLNDSALRFESRVKMASYCNLLGRYAQAQEHLQVAEGLAQRPTPTYLNTRAIAFAHTGKLTDSFLYFRRSAQSAEAAGDVYLQTVAFDDWANVATALGRIRTALQLRQRAVAIATKRGVLWRSSYLSLRYASTLMLIGEFQHAKDIVYETLAGGTESAGVRLLSAAVGIPLGLRTEDQELIKLCADSETLELGLHSAEPDRVGGVAAAFVDLYRSRGHVTEARHILRQGLRSLSTAHQAWDLLLLAALLGDEADTSAARGLLERESALPGHDLSKACLTLFDAFSAQRERRRLKAVRLAKGAANAFQAIGLWPYYAQALELSDMQAEAQTVYQRLGDIRSERRLKAETNNTRHRGRAGTALTRRENDIAALVADGYTNREIACRLKISENTVEHHLDSIFNRLSIRSRSRLAALMAEQHLEHRIRDSVS